MTKLLPANQDPQGLPLPNVYEYDYAGNQVRREGPGILGGLQTIVYDTNNRPISVTSGTGTGETTTLLYDALGSRVMKQSPDSTTVYLDRFYQRTTTQAAPTTFDHVYSVYAGGAVVAEVRRNVIDGTISGSDETLYIHADRLGSPMLISNQSGDEVARPFYGAFGEEGTLDIAPFSMPVTPTAASVSRFTGHRADGNLGLVDMGARLYDPMLGAFITPDPTRPDPFSTQGLNRYAYALNNPVNAVDPNGLQDYCDGGPCWNVPPPPDPDPDGGPGPQVTYPYHGDEIRGGGDPCAGIDDIFEAAALPGLQGAECLELRRQREARVAGSRETAEQPRSEEKAKSRTRAPIDFGGSPRANVAPRSGSTMVGGSNSTASVRRDAAQESAAMAAHYRQFAGFQPHPNKVLDISAGPYTDTSGYYRAMVEAGMPGPKWGLIAKIPGFRWLVGKLGGAMARWMSRDAGKVIVNLGGEGEVLGRGIINVQPGRIGGSATLALERAKGNRSRGVLSGRSRGANGWA